MTAPPDRRQLLCDWLTANGVDPNDVPRDADMTVTAVDGKRWLRCEVFVINAGERIANIWGTDGERTSVTVPLQTEPPTWWEPHEKPTREQLLNIVSAVQQLHRAAEHGGRVICVECSAYDGWTTTGNAPVDHPCATAKAIGTMPTAPWLAPAQSATTAAA